MPHDVALSVDQVAELVAACCAQQSRFAVAADTAARPPGSLFAVSLASPGGEVAARVRELSYAEGGLGFRVFPSAVLLAAFVAARPSLLAGRSVLELGAGLGLCGLAAALAGAAPSPLVTLSDFHNGVLSALQRAVADNGLDGRAEVASHNWVADSGGRGGAAAAPAALPAPSAVDELGPEYARVLGLQAGGPAAAPALAPGRRFSLLLGAEVLYEPVCAAFLPALLRARLECPGGRCLLVGAVRDAALIERLLAACAARGMRLSVRCPATLPPPPRGAAAAAAADAGAAQGRRDDAPSAGGGWMALPVAIAALQSGGPGGGPLRAAWLEIAAPEVAWTPDEAPACCARAARGLACPCALRRR